MHIVETLAESKIAKLLVVEPNIGSLPSSLKDKEDVRLVSLEEAMEQADIVLLLVDHKEFKQMDRNLLSGKAVIDTRGIFA